MLVAVPESPFSSLSAGYIFLPALIFLPAPPKNSPRTGTLSACPHILAMEGNALPNLHERMLAYEYLPAERRLWRLRPLREVSPLLPGARPARSPRPHGSPGLAWKNRGYRPHGPPGRAGRPGSPRTPRAHWRHRSSRCSGDSRRPRCDGFYWPHRPPRPCGSHRCHRRNRAARPHRSDWRPRSPGPHWCYGSHGLHGSPGPHWSHWLHRPHRSCRCRPGNCDSLYPRLPLPPWFHAVLQWLAVSGRCG